MGFNSLLFEVNEQIATITLNRPEAMNSLNDELMFEILDAVRLVTAREDVRVAILTANGKAFCAGADLKDSHGDNENDFMAYIKANQDVAWELYHCPKPLIAAVRGWTVGGGLEIALWCDIIMAAADAKFGFPDVNIGVLHTGGATYLMPRLIGLGRAKELALSGRFFSASEALGIGLINRVVEDDHVLEAAQEEARKLLGRSPVGLRWIKRAFNLGASSDLAAALSLETDGLLACYRSHDLREGVSAFLEKRKPVFTGR